MNPGNLFEGNWVEGPIKPILTEMITKRGSSLGHKNAGPANVCDLIEDISASLPTDALNWGNYRGFILTFSANHDCNRRQILTYFLIF